MEIREYYEKKGKTPYAETCARSPDMCSAKEPAEETDILIEDEKFRPRMGNCRKKRD